MKKKTLSLLLAALLAALPLSGCGRTAPVQAADLLSGIEPSEEAAQPMTGADKAAAAGFAVRLLQQYAAEGGGENILLSPLSALYALGMTMSGARGRTLEQMTAVLGLDEQGMERLCGYAAALSADGETALANSVWMRDDKRLRVEPDFLQKAVDCYGAGLYKAAFDEQTVRDINEWVSEKTGGRIDEIVDEIPPDALLYLVNALAFDAEWETAYLAHQVREGSFTAADGSRSTVQFMHSEERLYLQDGQARGFVKPYAGGRYAFAALLPGEGVSPEEYIASLTGEKLSALLGGAEERTINAVLPKFESGSRLELGRALQAMGMTDAFSDEEADFTGMAAWSAGNIFISRVLHHTAIGVDEKGTRAGAATAVEAIKESATSEEIQTVCLDRPFVYLIIDREQALPLFVGVLNSPER